jgi:hypothetical protein
MTIPQALAAALLCASLGPTSASAQTLLLRDSGEATTLSLLREGVLRARVVEADVAALRAATPAARENALGEAATWVTLDLFPDVSVTVALERRDDLPDGAVTFVGAVVGEPGGRASFAVDGDALAVDVVLPQGRYEVRYRADGRHVVQAVDPSVFRCGTPDPPGAAVGALRAETLPVFEGAAVVVDLLLVYTARAATDAGGVAGIRSVIHLAIATTNDALARSLVPHRVRAVHIAPTPYVEVGRLIGNGGDFQRVTNFADGFMDELPALRDSVQADLVAVVTGPMTDAGGLGELLYTFNPNAGVTFGYSMNIGAGLSYVLPHELGHNFGLHHDPETSPNPPVLLPYGVGYRIPGRFGTIMAYPCGAGQAPCPGINNYSNPAVLHNGTPTGVANVHEEARALIQTMPVAASYRGCQVGLSPAVTRLHVGAGGGAVAVGVTTDSECAWLVEESPPRDWITRTTPAHGRDSGTITYTVASNTTPFNREQAIGVNGRYVYIEQRACLEISPTTPFRFTEAGGTGTLAIDASPGCAWSVDPVSPNGILTLTSPASGVGPGSLTFSAAPSPPTYPSGRLNALVVRSANVVRMAEVVRDGAVCSAGIAIAPATLNAAGSGAAHQVTVTAPPSCAWSLSELPAWITAIGAPSGTGNGSVTLSVASNPEYFPRTGVPSISGRAVYVRQRGCEPGVALPGEVSAAGGPVDIPITAASPCYWLALTTTTAMRTENAAATGSGVLRLVVLANPDTSPRQLTFTVNERPYALTQRARSETVRRYLSEGATGSFFSTRFAVLNPGDQTIEGRLRFQLANGSVRTRFLTVPPRRRMTITPESVPDLGSADFATVLESSGPLLLDRTMTWDRSGFGSHAETSLPEPSRTWYLAEGSTTGDFSLFYLLQNPNPAATVATITFLLPGGASPIVHTFPLGPSSRRTIPIDGLGPPLDATDVSAVITAPDPIIVERAMYATRAGQSFAAGHNSAAVTAPALQWFLAEGATGAFFDLFVLIANPNPEPARLTVDYLLPNGTALSKEYVVAANSRSTIWVDDEQIPAGSGQRPLADVSLSTTVRSTNGVPVIVERAMWWPGPQLTASYWMEAHNSAGATVTGTRWALAEGEVGGPNDTETFILIANTSATDGSVRIQLLFEDGTAAERVVAVPARSRTTIAGGSFASAAQKRFGTVVESLGAPGAPPAQIVVERAMYSNGNGVFWSAGTNALATRLAP